MNYIFYWYTLYGDDMLFIVGLIFICYLYLMTQGHIINEMRCFSVFLCFLLSLCIKDEVYSKDDVVKIQWTLLFILVADYCLFNPDMYYVGILFYIMVMSILFLFVYKPICFVGEAFIIISLLFSLSFEVIVTFYSFMLLGLCLVSCLKREFHLIAFLFLFLVSDFFIALSYITAIDYTYLSWSLYVPALLVLLLPYFRKTRKVQRVLLQLFEKNSII